MNEVNFKVGDVVLLGEPFQDSVYEFVILSFKPDGAIILPRHANALKALPLLPPIPVEFLKHKVEENETPSIGFSGFRSTSRR